MNQCFKFKIQIFFRYLILESYHDFLDYIPIPINGPTPGSSNSNGLTSGSGVRWMFRLSICQLNRELFCAMYYGLCAFPIWMLVAAPPLALGFSTDRQSEREFVCGRSSTLAASAKPTHQNNPVAVFLLINGICPDPDWEFLPSALYRRVVSSIFWPLAPLIDLLCQGTNRKEEISSEGGARALNNSLSKFLVLLLPYLLPFLPHNLAPL